MTLDDMLKEIQAANTIDWYQSPAPNRRDITCLAVVELLRRSDAAPARAALRGHDSSVRFQLFAFRMIELSVHTRSIDLLETAAAVLAMMGVAERESYALLALVHHAASSLNIDADDLLRRASHFADLAGRERILGFVTGPPSSKSLESMGFREVRRSDGVHYEADAGVAIRAAMAALERKGVDSKK
ncbi:MAG TPA: hypothetical protein VFL36_14920 [Myxococcales bacterium]|nr:hypothetical protein [Myxococcales bacterium]